VVLLERPMPSAAAFGHSTTTTHDSAAGMCVL
jgi:hypothetical protein